MKRTLFPVIATAALAAALQADTKQPPVPAKEIPAGGPYEIRFGKEEESLGPFISSKVLFSLPGDNGNKIDHSRRALLVKDRYIVFLDNSATSGIQWQGEDKEMSVFLTHPAGKKIKAVEKSPLQQLTLSESGKNAPANIAVIPLAREVTVNGVAGNPGLNIAPGISQQMAVARKAGETDRIFWSHNGDPVTLSNTHWAVDAHAALIRENGKESTRLVALGNSEKSTNRVATRFVSLEIEGANVGIEGTISKPLKDPMHKVEVTGISGHYFAEKGGTLRLQFGLPTQTAKQQNKRLLAFWKFDEGKGSQCMDLKADGKKSAIIGMDPKKAWDKGVGFGKVSSVTLESEAHIQTSFTEDLQGSNSIALWIKTTSGGLLLSKVAGKGDQLLPGSRMVQVTPTGEVKLTLIGSGEETILSEAKVNDGKWHHVAWTVREQADEGMRVSLVAQHCLYIDSKLQGQLDLKREYDSEPVDSPLHIGKAIKYSKDAKPVTISGFTGAVDNLRIYNFPLNEKQISGFNLVGRKTSPFVITSTPKETIHVGERFDYAIKFTGVPTASFKFNTLPDWIKFEGQLTGIPAAKDLGVTKPISIVGMSRLGPGQQIFNIKVLPPLVAPEWKVLVDGKPVPTRYVGLGIEADLPPGSAKWRFARN